MTMRDVYKRQVIYYPEQKMDLMEEELPKNFLLEWQHDTMVRLVHVARSVGNKYTRSKVRKAMSPEFAYVMAVSYTHLFLSCRRKQIQRRNVWKKGM